jgi:hypothetical protein
MGRTGRRALAAVGMAMFMSVVAGGARADERVLIARVEATLASGVEASSAHDAVVAFGDQGERALRAVFEREGAPLYVRLRALGVLAQFPTEETARYFERLIRAAQRPDASLGALHPARSPLVLRRALEGLTPLVALLRPPPKLEDFAFCLAHAEAHVRRAAADLLAELEVSGVDAVLTKRLQREPSRMVRGRVQQALTSRSAALPRAR